MATMGSRPTLHARACGGHGSSCGRRHTCDKTCRACQVLAVVSALLASQAPLGCLAQQDEMSSSGRSWLTLFQDGDETPAEHIWGLMDKSQDAGLSATEVISVFGALNGIPPRSSTEDEHRTSKNLGDCGGHGHLHGDECHCEQGYKRDPHNTLLCVLAKQAVECGGHGHIHGESCHCDAGYELDPQNAANCLAEGEAECGGHGHLHGGSCHCDAGYVVHESNLLLCEAEIDAHNDHQHRRHLLQACSGHGHLHGGSCHCNSGYVTDPQDNTACVLESAVTVPSAPGATNYILLAEELIIQAGVNGSLYPDSLAQVLPYIVSCQMDPACKLEMPAMPAPTLPVPPPRVEGWIVGVGVVIMLVMGLIGLGVPWYFARSLEKPSVKVGVMLANCLSAGILFSLGIMHVIPHTIELMYQVDVNYPLNFLLIVVGFFVTLFFEHVMFDHETGFPSTACEHYTDKSAIDVASSKLDVSDMGTSHQLKAVRIDYGSSSSSDSGQEVFMNFAHMLPSLLFFVALQFHGCLEAMVIGMASSATNFWILLAAVCIHKLFVTFALGLKLVVLRGVAPTWYLVSLTCLWVVLPPAFIAVGFGIISLNGGTSAITVLVLQSLAGGTFIYVGAFELLHESFLSGSNCHVSDHASSSVSVSRYWKFAACVLGVAVIAAYSAIPHVH